MIFKYFNGVRYLILNKIPNNGEICSKNLRDYSKKILSLYKILKIYIAGIFIDLIVIYYGYLIANQYLHMESQQRVLNIYNYLKTENSEKSENLVQT